MSVSTAPIEGCAPLAAPVLSLEEASATAALFSALGNTARVRLVNLLAASEEPVCFCNLAAPVGLAPATVSEHLKKLVEAGLVLREERGKWAYYSINDEAFERIVALADLAEGRRLTVSETLEAPEVLFVCVHNAGRSQMAAGLLKLRSSGRIHVRSAGSAPGEEINPAVITAMAEVGVDMGEEFPKPLTDEFVQAADVVITMGCGDACPIFPGKRYEDWELDDPAGQTVAAVRVIRDEIDERVQRLIAALLPAEQ